MRLHITLAVLLIVLIRQTLSAATGDTTSVVVMDKYYWTGWGWQDRTVQCPPKGISFEKVLLRYRLTCPTGGCGEWDYTTRVILRHRTGELDSSLTDAPSFRVDGSIFDSVHLSFSANYDFNYNTQTKKTDTVLNAPVNIVFYRDPLHPFQPTDTLTAWIGNYLNYIYDASGKAIDSVLVGYDTTLYVIKKKAYLVFDKIIPYELTRYITPYGKGLPKDWSNEWVVDITDFAFLLRDSVEIRSVYDGYTPGSLYSLQLDFIEGKPLRETYRADLIYDGYFAYGNTSDPIENHLPPVTLPNPDSADMITLRLVTSGHGQAEFLVRTHSVSINGTKRYDQNIWRTDCGQSPVFPQTGTFWAPRGGWCPGDIVHPFDYDLKRFAGTSPTFTVDYNMATGSGDGGGYYVQGIVFYSKSNAYPLDAAVETIVKPTSMFLFNRQNPICSGTSPVIVIANRGTENISSLKILYGTDKESLHLYQWSGLLESYETETVSLPPIDLGSGTQNFYVELADPNGSIDANPLNNKAQTVFTNAAEYGSRIALMLRVSRYDPNQGIPNGIRWELLDGSGSVIKEGRDYDDGTLVRDTFRLAAGCYQFVIYDESVGIGLTPAFYPGIFPNSTNGSYSLRDEKNKYIVNATASNVQAQFGDKFVTTFTVGGSSNTVAAQKQELRFDLFPNPSAGELTLRTSILEEITLTICDLLGTEVYRSVIPAGSSLTQIGTAFAEGSYIVRLESDTLRASKRLVIMK